MGTTRKSILETSFLGVVFEGHWAWRSSSSDSRLGRAPPCSSFFPRVDSRKSTKAPGEYLPIDGASICQRKTGLT